jgi:hypothetical protein
MREGPFGDARADMNSYAERELEDFKIAIVALEIHDWEAIEVTFEVRHNPSRVVAKFENCLSKDDYLLRRAEISGSRTNFVERNPKMIAEWLVEQMRLKRRRGDSYGNVGICDEDIEICDWNGTTRSFERRH